MRLAVPRTSSHIGQLGVLHQTDVVELDAGEATNNPSDHTTVGVSYSVLNMIQRKMVIMVPCKNEPPETIEGVLRGIPNQCFLALVSNSTRDSTADRYAKEVEMLQQFCRNTGRQGLAIHQKDRGAAAALCQAGFPDLVGPDGTVRNGKGEGMILGMAVVAALCPDMQYVGFIDADSKMPGSPHEYCRAYASGFALYESAPSEDEQQHIMVRLRWRAKPKVRNGRLDFSVSEGRSSRVVNAWLNRTLALLWERTETDGTTTADDETDTDQVVSTANAGEHAMTMGLALKLRMAGGYAIEPFHFVDLLERQLRSPCLTPTSSAASSDIGCMSDAGSSTGSNTSSGSSSSGCLETSPVRIVQIRTLNAHLHTETEDSHVRNMWKMGLGTIYHHLFPLYSSPDAEDDELSESINALRREMLDFVIWDDRQFASDNGLPESPQESNDEILPRPMIYPPLETIDFAALAKELRRNGAAESLHIVGH
ncbi:mannosyl-3-phosphoglycerate synthase [Echria macrotheca]|uniref:Mannosyl-3-phosphoglycerate synthase n=1 Tax=Echria macrotheca TaxID=438768 RepID=A0AAJ0F2S3_9PEZI|nr:mannosyl-3-phosphoglycerate synthase [Echria macrotheca]